MNNSEMKKRYLASFLEKFHPRAQLTESSGYSSSCPILHLSCSHIWVMEVESKDQAEGSPAHRVSQAIFSLRSDSKAHLAEPS